MARKRKKKAYQWAALDGHFEIEENIVRFIGGPQEYGQETGVAVGTVMTDQWFGSGTVTASVRFEEPGARTACDLVLFRNPSTGAFVSAGLSNEILYGIRHFDSKWTTHASAGAGNLLEAGQDYVVKARVRGSLITLIVNGVEVCAANLPVPLPRSQVGVWCRGMGTIEVGGYEVVTEPPQAFVVMQFTSPYNELYQEVVKPVCDEFGVQARRADDTFGPGLIIADVVRQIDEAKFVIAEITPANPNVYYEVGYSHARGKPTVLIAERSVEQLPFDLSPFRVLFYENSIDGKRRVEEGLRKHLKAILDPSERSAV